MEPSRMQAALRALVGLIEGFLILHGGLNLFGTSTVRESAIAFAVCAGLVAALLLVWPKKLIKH